MEPDPGLCEADSKNIGKLISPRRVLQKEGTFTFHGAGFLHSGSVDPVNSLLLGYPVHCGMFISIPGFCCRCQSTHLPAVTILNVSRHYPGGMKSPWLKTTVVEGTEKAGVFSPVNSNLMTSTFSEEEEKNSSDVRTGREVAR